MFASNKGYNIKYIEYGRKNNCANKFIDINFIDKSSILFNEIVKYTWGIIIKLHIIYPKKPNIIKIPSFI